MALTLFNKLTTVLSALIANPFLVWKIGIYLTFDTSGLQFNGTNCLSDGKG